MSPTVKTVLIVGGIAAGAYVVAKLVAPKPTTNLSVFGNSGAATAGIAQGAIAGIASLFSGNASSSSNPSGTPSTATSNYLADQTANSDTASGVVGFGGWD